jgi:hypothetical protein
VKARGGKVKVKVPEDKDRASWVARVRGKANRDKAPVGLVDKGANNLWRG